jgi:hypothetical protein
MAQLMILTILNCIRRDDCRKDLPLANKKSTILNGENRLETANLIAVWRIYEDFFVFVLFGFTNSLW